MFARVLVVVAMVARLSAPAAAAAWEGLTWGTCPFRLLEELHVLAQRRVAEADSVTDGRELR
nr:hypothetical protein GCM10020241_04640 [Streptoalloteichus tenebrarius]